MSDRPRFLVLGDSGPAGADWLRRCGLEGDVVHADSWDNGLDQLGRQRLDALVANPADASVLHDLRTLVQGQQILATLPDGAAVVDADLRVHWANPTFVSWCGGPVVGRGFYEALGSPAALGPEFCPFRTALASSTAAPPTVTTRLLCRGDRAIDLHIRPLGEPDGPLLLALGRDVTALVRQQQKLDALHKAGRELAALSADQLADMSVAERIELLKLNIRRFTRDLLHYETIEIRLLDPRTGRLEPLMQEGMAPLAANRVLMASARDNGVTGYVAATGKSRLCPDISADPLYLPGAPAPTVR